MEYTHALAFQVPVIAGDADAEADMHKDEWLNWKEYSLNTRYKLSMPSDAQPWTKEHQLKGLPSGPRQRDVVQVAYWAWLRSQRGCLRKTATPDWHVDASQSVHRMTWGPDPSSFNTASMVYYFALDRCLDNEDSITYFQCNMFPHLS